MLKGAIDNVDNISPLDVALPSILHSIPVVASVKHWFWTHQNVVIN